MSRPRPPSRHSWSRLAVGAGARLRLVGGAIGVIWTLELVDRLFFGGHLDQLGVRPRTWSGLWGILAAPLLHGGFAHLVSNTVPAFVLGMLATTRAVSDFWRVVVAAGLSAGLGSWLFGSTGSVHIGASGVVFGFLGFLMARGYFERSAVAVVVSVAVTVLFGSMLWGMVPVVAGVGISWQAHLFGWVGGVLVARSLPRPRRRR